MPERFAIYYAPAVDDPLWLAANAWYAKHPAITVSARRYGFHATLTPPFELAPATMAVALEVDMRVFAQARRAVPIGRIALRSIGGGFLALVPEIQGEALTGLAADCIRHFKSHRAPLTADERERRLAAARLTPRQVELLDTWGYPYVMEQFQFHMTLTDKLDEAAVAPVMAGAKTHFAAFIGRELVLDRLVLFHQPEAGAPFVRGPEAKLTPR
jgi:hypothetical protein